MIARLARLVADAGESFEDYDYARALQRTEELFWWYCDYYLELVKGRRYSPDAEVAAAVEPRAAPLAVGLPAPVRAVPAVRLRGGLVVVAGGLDPPRAVARGRGAGRGGAGRSASEREELALEVAADVLREVRKAKSDAKRPMRAPVARVVVQRQRPSGCRRSSSAPATCARPARSRRSRRPQAEEFSVEVELAEDG